MAYVMLNTKLDSHESEYRKFRDFSGSNKIPLYFGIASLLYSVSRKSNINRFSQFFTVRKRMQFPTDVRQILPHLTCVATLASKMQTFKNNTNCAEISKLL